MEIQVKVAKLGRAVATLEVLDGDSVEVAIKAAGVDAEKAEIRVNNEPATPATPLHDGDRVTVVPAIRGGAQ